MTNDLLEQQLKSMTRSLLQDELERQMPRGNAVGETFEATTEGNEAVVRGSEIYYDASQQRVSPPTASELNELGKEKLLLWFGIFYRRQMRDPRMVVLFDTTNNDTNVSAAQHGKRLALALLSRWTGDAEYFEVVGHHQRLIGRIREAHDRAKSCPLRSKQLRGKGFTVDQRNAWLGHLNYAAAECNISSAMQNKVCTYLATVIGVYGPFVDANSANVA